MSGALGRAKISESHISIWLMGNRKRIVPYDVVFIHSEE